MVLKLKKKYGLPKNYHPHSERKVRGPQTVVSSVAWTWRTVFLLRVAFRHSVCARSFVNLRFNRPTVVGADWVGDVYPLAGSTNAMLINPFIQLFWGHIKQFS